MTNETSCFVGAAGLGFAHETIDELGAHNVAPTPANYEVWATYRCGVLGDLNQEIDRRMSAGEPLSSALCEDLFDRYFTPTRSFDTLLQTGESIAHELATALASLREAGSSAGGYAGHLEHAASIMETSADPRAIQVLMRHLISETRAMATRNKDLEARIDASSKHVETLQATVRQATLEAVTDGLTGLANRKHFDRQLTREVGAAAEAGQPLALILCDIDHFKQINDNWGHPIGDQVIRYVAGILAMDAPHLALAARYGGEEFALLLPHMPIAEAQVHAQNICERVRARTITRKSSGDIIGRISISAGVAALQPGESGQALVRRADACLYEAKRAGRNRVVTETELAAAAA
jgi:diguanylate cyclase